MDAVDNFDQKNLLVIVSTLHNHLDSHSCANSLLEFDETWRDPRRGRQNEIE
jgi:hypothetical protein